MVRGVGGEGASSSGEVSESSALTRRVVKHLAGCGGHVSFRSLATLALDLCLPSGGCGKGDNARYALRDCQFLWEFAGLGQRFRVTRACSRRLVSQRLLHSTSCPAICAKVGLPAGV